MLWMSHAPVNIHMYNNSGIPKRVNACTTKNTHTHTNTHMYVFTISWEEASSLQCL